MDVNVNIKNVTSGNTNDCVPHSKRLEYQIDKFGFETKTLCPDGGYDNCEVYEAMLNTNPFLNCGYYVSSKRDWYKRGIKNFIPRRAKPVSRANYEEALRE